MKIIIKCQPNEIVDLFLEITEKYTAIMANEIAPLVAKRISHSGKICEECRNNHENNNVVENVNANLTNI